jgi:hypothetical protein
MRTRHRNRRPPPSIGLPATFPREGERVVLHRGKVAQGGIEEMATFSSSFLPSLE